MFGVVPSSLRTSGRQAARAGVTTAKRLEVCRTSRHGGILPGYEASGWYGIAAPKDTPPEIVEKLNKEINAALPMPR
jgi:tripartite-type tricarboxylate transporter receptor subunit TctC